MSKDFFFKRVLRLRHIFAISIGGTVSSTYFLGDGYVLNKIGPMAFLAFALGGIITIITMACMAEMASHEEPSHHSFINYAREYLSPTWACGIGWSYWANWIFYIPTECISGGILMQTFFPAIPVYVWASFFLFLLTAINLTKAQLIGRWAFILTFTHVAVLVGFTIIGVSIFFGWAGNHGTFLGWKYLTGEGGLFPNGVAALFINMLIMMLNFQGTEISGLSASEAHRPRRDVASVMKDIPYTVTALYVFPIMVLAFIFPWDQTDIKGSVFGAALVQYGFNKTAVVLTFLVVAGALSCIHSGFYAAGRSMHALADMGMAPAIFKKINQHGMPFYAVLISFLASAVIMYVALLTPSILMYNILLGISGFSGAIPWLSICWSQLHFRKRLPKDHVFHFKLIGYPFTTYFAIWALVACCIFIMANPDFRPSFYVGLIMLVIPMIIYRHKHMHHHHND